MMWKRSTSVWLSAVVCLAFAAKIAAHTEATPEQVVESTAMAVAESLAGREAYFEEHPAELYALVDELLQPRFDVRYSGRLVLGKHWKTITKDQRDRFVEVFYRFLLQSYSNGILGFEQDSVRIIPPDEAPGEKRVVVKTKTRTDDGNEVPINYSMRNSSSGWRVYDVRIEGVSYVQNYRNQFNAEISALGIEAVIDRLNAVVDAAAAAH